MSPSSSTPDSDASSAKPEKAPDVTSCDAPRREKSWVWLAVVAGHFGAAVGVLLSILSLVAFGFNVSDITQYRLATGWALAFAILAVLYFAFALLAEVITIGLHRRRKWAWFAALPLFALWLLSAIFPLGAMGMFGLLTRGSRREFGLVAASDDRGSEAGRIDSPIDSPIAPSQRDRELSAALSDPQSRSNAYASSTKPGTAPSADLEDAPTPQKSWVWLALVGGHLGAAVLVLYAIGMLAVVGLAVVDIPENDGAASAAFSFGSIALVSLTLAVGAEVVTIGMHRRSQWAWFAGFAMFVLYLAFFFPAGAMGLCGLLMGGSRREFGIA